MPTSCAPCRIGSTCKRCTGHASHPKTLYRAGAEDADMLIAVTNSDEINMMACQIAYTLFKTPTKISRVRSPNYLAHEDLFNSDHVPIDVLIGPEQLVTKSMRDLIANPGALQVLDFADGRVQLVAVKAFTADRWSASSCKEIRKHMPQVDTRVAAIFRRDQSIIPEGTTVVEADDEVFFIAAKEHIRAVMSELRRLDKPYKRIMIAGGGNIGSRLAAAIDGEYQVKLIERSYSRCRELSEEAQARHRAQRQRLGHGTAELGEHRGDRRVLCADQQRRGQHHDRHAGQAHGGAQGHYPDHQPRLYRPVAG